MKKILSVCVMMTLPGLFGSSMSVCAGETRFHEVCASKAEAAFNEQQSVVQGLDGWYFLASELRHISVGPFWGDAAADVSRATRPAYADPLPAIVDFNDQLQQAGVKLIFVPVPPKAVVYPEKVDASLANEVDRLDSQHQQFYGLLRDKGVDVVDLVPAFREAVKRGEKIYCQTDSHWSGRACEIAADLLGSSIHEEDWVAAIPKTEWSFGTRPVSIQGDLGELPGGEQIEEEMLDLTFVGVQSEQGIEAVENDETSPILLLGDSHNLVFHAGDDMHARGAGLADQLKKITGINIDVLGVRGSGATPSRISLMRRCRKNPDYLSGKKVVIWCLSSREFTEGSGWRQVPLLGK